MMKKGFLMVSVFILSLSMLSAASIDMDRKGNNPLSGNTDIKLNYDYDPERYYHFIFSDHVISKDGNFDELFATTGLDWITMSTLKDDHLECDKNVYVYWLIDESQPIEKLTLEIPAALRLDDKNTLDLYASWDNNQVGGAFGYGIANARTIYDRNLDAEMEGNNSIKLKLWTGDIKGKQAGDYKGSVVIRVYGDNK